MTDIVFQLRTLDLVGWAAIAGIFAVLAAILQLLWMALYRVFVPYRSAPGRGTERTQVDWSFDDMPDWPGAAHRRDALLEEWSQK